MISFFRAPIKNITPQAQVSVLQIYKYITSDYAKEVTERLRSMCDHVVARRYKGEMLDYVTFSGCFSSRRTGDLIEHSGFLCFDIDKIESEERLQEIKSQLINDEELHTVLCFRSPSGNGLKWVVEVPDRYWLGVSHTENMSHTDDLSHTDDILHTDITDITEDAVASPAILSPTDDTDNSDFNSSFSSIRSLASQEVARRIGTDLTPSECLSHTDITEDAVASPAILSPTDDTDNSDFNSSFSSITRFARDFVFTRHNPNKFSLYSRLAQNSLFASQEVALQIDTDLTPSVFDHSPYKQGESCRDVIVKNHRVLYERIRGYLFERYGIETDHTSDIARPCYLCHDDDAYYDEPTFHSNPASRFLIKKSVRENPTSIASSNLCKSDERLLTKSKQRIEKELNNQSVLCNLWETKTSKNKKNYENDIEKIVRDIERRSLDITDDYHNWMLVAMALAGTYGSAGEGYFHRISQYSSKYDNKEAHRMYQSCLRNNNGLVGIGTIVYLIHNS